MSRGFLIFAHNNSKINYGTLAMCAALCIKTNLVNHDVALVADEATWAVLRATYDETLLAATFDHHIIEPACAPMERRFYDGVESHVLDWFNGSRHRAYEVTPFAETILLDADFLVQDNWLDLCFGSDNPVMMNHHVVALDHHPMHDSDVRLDIMSIPLYWATVVYFRQCAEAAQFFHLIDDIRNNYLAYQALYDFAHGPYRNDFIFSIAAHMWSGFIENNFPSLPSPVLVASLSSDELVEVGRNSLLVLVHDRKARVHHLTKVKNLSVHVMNKFSLLRQADRIIGSHAPI